MKYIGLSLSFCMRDLVNGKVDVDDVMYLVTGTNFPETYDATDVLNRYKGGYLWADDPKALKFITHFMSTGRFIQPRRMSRVEPNIGKGHWAVISRL